jgi:hypothetical protein
LAKAADSHFESILLRYPPNLFSTASADSAVSGIHRAVKLSENKQTRRARDEDGAIDQQLSFIRSALSPDRTRNAFVLRSLMPFECWFALSAFQRREETDAQENVSQSHCMRRVGRRLGHNVVGRVCASARYTSAGPADATVVVPSATVNLMTAEGSATFGAVWRTAEARVVEVEPMAGRMPGYDKTFDMQPHAGEANFDDSKWQVIEPKGLADRRGGGKSSFLWYRTTLTIPTKVGDFDTTGAKAVFTAYVDDYAEVWINGQMPRRSGYPSPATIQGLNMPNRVVLAETVNPGDKFQIAVFGINGPISVAPSNFICFRDAKMEFYR